MIDNICAAVCRLIMASKNAVPIEVVSLLIFVFADISASGKIFVLAYYIVLNTGVKWIFKYQNPAIQWG